MMLLDVLKDAAVDTVKLIPFLYLTYLLMEYLESRTADASAGTLGRAGKLGPLFGGIVGAVPQCGFSAAAASLFSGGVITAGTLMAVFLATSDEMLPIMISESVRPDAIFKILGTKVLIGVISGFVIDFLLAHIPHKTSERHIHDLCEQDHCGCDDDEDGEEHDGHEHGHGRIFLPALIHTVEITIYIFIFSFIIGFLVEGVGANALAGFMTRQKVVGVLIAALIGLIPNCAASVLITELYLKGILAAGQMMAGLLVGAGVGLLVLFRNNRHPREDLILTLMLYICGAAWGLLIEALGIAF